jgi:DNA-binding HxlR family transcriptional regulator
MKIPKPGRAVRGSQSGRPVMALLDLLGRRMALRIIWELKDQCLTFRALEAAVETNPSVLNTRLKELRVAGLVEHTSDGYRLTDDGRTLLALMLPLAEWSLGWAKRLARRESGRG